MYLMSSNIGDIDVIIIHLFFFFLYTVIFIFLFSSLILFSLRSIFSMYREFDVCLRDYDTDI